MVSTYVSVAVGGEVLVESELILDAPCPALSVASTTAVAFILVKAN